MSRYDSDAVIGAGLWFIVLTKWFYYHQDKSLEDAFFEFKFIFILEFTWRKGKQMLNIYFTGSADILRMIEHHA